MQPHLTMPQVWIHEVREVREAGVEFGDGLGKRLWKYGWGLVFVLAMTLLAEYGPVSYTHLCSTATRWKRAAWLRCARRRWPCGSR